MHQPEVARLTGLLLALVVVAPAGEHAADPLIEAARALPSSITVVLDAGAAATFAAAGFELLEGRTAVDGRSTAYVCHDFMCRLPVTEAAALAT